VAESKKYLMTHDSFFKSSMAIEKVALEFFSAHLPKQILDCIDLSTLKAENSDFANSTLGNGTVDLLYSVKWNNQTGYISILIEHQSTPDKSMPLRIQKYMLRICDEYHTRNPDSKLPPIYPLLVYTGKTKYTVPLSFWEMFSEPELAKQYFTNPIHLLELRTIKDIDLRHRYHSGIVLSLMQAIHERNIMPYLYKIKPLIYTVSMEDLHIAEYMLGYILDNAEGKNEELIIEFFANTVSEEHRGKIMSMADRLVEKGVQQGMQQGMQQGVQQRTEQIVCNMLASNMTVEDIAKVTKLPLEEIKGFSKERAH
jgi:predicted transposase/invertase (TIGR01784 family)